MMMLEGEAEDCNILERMNRPLREICGILRATGAESEGTTEKGGTHGTMHD
jgi:hypothetical protein